jgi:hypothetical protein
MIQGCSEINSGIADNAGQSFWELFRDSDFAHDVTWKLRVGLNNWSVGIALEEDKKLFFKVSDVFLSACEFTP